MSRSATASTPKNPSQLPPKSVWARGPPQQNSANTTPRSQSPALPTPVSATNPAAFHATHSRRPSALGQGVSIKDGVSIPRNAVKQGSPVTFGSIDDAPAPISSSPASAPAVKPVEGVKSFGSVAVQNGGSDPAKSAVTSRPPPLSAPSTSSTQPAAAPTSTSSTAPKFDKKSIAKLFQGPSQSVVTPPPEVASPATRPAPLPSQQPGQSQPYQPPFASGGLRQGQNGNSSAPRSPVYPRSMANGQNNSVGVSGRPQAGSGGPSAGPAPTALPSPRLTPHPPPGPPSGMPPHAMWPGYYYSPSFVPGVPPPDQYYPPQWPSHLLPPQHQPPPPHHVPGPAPPSSGLPMSPRNPPLPLQQVPGTPTQSHAIPPIHHPPHPPAPHPAPSVTSPPPTPLTTNRSTSLSANAGAFVPGKKISIKNPSGQEVNILDTLKRPPPATVPPTPPSPASGKKDIKRQPIRIESEEQKEKRLAEERAKGDDVEEKSKPNEALVKANEEATRREEQGRLKAEEERRAKEDAERADKERKEAEARAALEKERKEAEERALREEAERKEAQERAAREARERDEREKERLRLEAEARAQREAEEKAEKERAEQERLQRLRDEEESRAKEEAERQRKAQEDAIEASEDAHAPADDEESTSLPEEGEIEDEASQPFANKTEDLAPADKADPTSSSPPPPAPPAESPTKSSEKEPLRIDTSLPSPEHQRKRPDPLNLQTAINSDIAPPLPSALATARHIEDINRITYPQGIKSPKVELNVNTQKGKFRYDRDFLLQFMNICKEKPDNLPPLDVIGLEPSDTSHTMSRGGSGRNRTSSSMSMPGNNRSASIGLGFLPGSMGKSAGSAFQMGQFSTSANKMSSEERFLASSGRSTSVSGGPLGTRPPAMVRTISQSGTGRERTRSKRGANESNRATVVGNAGPAAPVSNMGPPMDPVAPLEVSANRWVASSTRRGGSGLDVESPEIVDRKVKGLLNKLTMERFDSISDQIITWANKSEREKDGRTLIQVIKLVFEKATDEATFSEMYARLCRKMMEQISHKVQDDGIKNTEGKPFAGGQLFRKYLLNRCQEDFERGWVAKEATAAAAATKATEDKAVKEANEKTKGGEEESELYSDEYYAAAKAKRRGLGLIRFIGELFKLQMLTERIMHECIKKLLGNVENPEEEEIESLCKLLTTVGSLLDTPKARAHLDVYFSRMRELTKNKNVNARMMFMLQDVIELRERKWIPRNAVAAPTTIAQVHEANAKEKLAQEKESYLRQNTSMSRGGSRRGGNRDAAEAPHPEGWSIAGSTAPARQPPKVGDLSQFGKISKAPPISFGPGSVFAGKKGADPKNRDPSMTRTPSTSSNMFSMLQNSDAAVEPPTSKGSRPPSRKPSVDLGAGSTPELAPQRRRLQLLPRSRPVGEESKGSTPAVSEAGTDDEAGGETGTHTPAAMSEAEAKAKIGEDTKEFFSVRMLDEAESYFSSLPPEHRHLLVDALVMKSIDMKEPDVTLVSDLFVRVREKDLCNPAVFEEGFNGLAELLDDLAVDIPKAWPYFVVLLKGSGLDQDEERRGRIAEKTMDPDKLNGLL